MTQAEVVQKVTNWVNTVHKGDWSAAFNAEDTDHDGKLDHDEICVILAKAKIGLMAPGRWLVATSVIRVMDSDNDGKVSLEEFQRVTHVLPPT